MAPVRNLEHAQRRALRGAVIFARPCDVPGAERRLGEFEAEVAYAHCFRQIRDQGGAAADGRSQAQSRRAEGMASEADR